MGKPSLFFSDYTLLFANLRLMVMMVVVMVLMAALTLVAVAVQGIVLARAVNEFGPVDEARHLVDDECRNPSAQHVNGIVSTDIDRGETEHDVEGQQEKSQLL